MRAITIIGLAVGSLGLIGCGGGDQPEARRAETSAGAEQPGTPTQQRRTHAGSDMAAADPAPTPTHAPGHARGPAHEEGCPMQIPGTELRAEDIEGGVGLVFTTTHPEQVEPLRESVRAMAPMHAQQDASTEGLMMEPEAEVTVVDIADGARLELRAEDPADVAALRRQGRMRADLMIRGACPLIPPQQASLVTVSVSRRPG